MPDPDPSPDRVGCPPRKPSRGFITSPIRSKLSTRFIEREIIGSSIFICSLDRTSAPPSFSFRHPPVSFLSPFSPSPSTTSLSSPSAEEPPMPGVGYSPPWRSWIGAARWPSSSKGTTPKSAFTAHPSLSQVTSSGTRISRPRFLLFSFSPIQSSIAILSFFYSPSFLF